MLKVLGQRILLKVKKYNKEELQKIEGSILYRVNLTEQDVEQETRAQSQAEVVQLGTQAFMNKMMFPGGNPGVSIGDKVYFSRYGAQPVLPSSLESDTDNEYWVITDKDLLLVE